MRMKLFIIVLLGFVFFVGSAQAGINLGESYLQEDYGPGVKIVGWSEIGFENETINNTLKDSFGNSVDLLELLGLNPSYNYTLNSTTGIINSNTQKIYFSNASFYVPLSPVSLNYTINISNVTILNGSISVSNSQNIILNMIDDKREDVGNFSNKISSYDLFLRSSISSVLNLSKIEEELDDIEADYNTSDSQSDYDALLIRLGNVKVPQSISESESANRISFVSDKNEIDLELIQGIGGGTYDSSKESAYKDYVIFWNQENLKPEITFKKINANYGSSNENILSYFEISVQRSSSKSYLVIEDLDGLKFKENYDDKKDSGYVYIDLSGIENKIIFTTTEDVSFDSLPLFFSPSLTELSVEDIGSDIIDGEEESKISKWVLFGLVMIFLIILFIVSYILLKTWYDRRYENYLFKNRNHLYNLIVYINNAIKKGMKKEEIEKNLRKAKWSNEQVRYVMRKYAGKRTGMWGPSRLRNKINPKSHKN
jgi:hypothetical protein